MRGLVVGRFQPFHHGHRLLVQQAIEDCVDVVVGIGSSNAPRSVRNPFSADERLQMVHAALGDAVRVVLLPDIHDPPNWVDHVMALTGAVDKVFGNDDRTLNLFEDADVPVARTGHFDREQYQAKTIRMQMAEGDPAWRKAVPEPVAALLADWDAEKRLRRLEAYA